MNLYPSIGKRYLGGLIDYFVFYAVAIGYFIVFGERNDFGGVSITGIKTLVFPIWWFVYFPVIEGISGQTLGKKILKLRVATLSGNDIGFGDSFLRHLVDFIDMFLFGVVGIVIMNNSDKRQRLGDQLAKTIVVEDQEAICIKCGEQLVLNYRELERGKFVCPNCKQENIVVQSLNSGFDSNILDAR